MHIVHPCDPDGPVAFACAQAGCRDCLESLVRRHEGLYDVTGVSSNSVGFWDLMASGSWNGQLGGSEPASMSLWDRYMLGWADPAVLNTTSPQVNLTLGQLADPPAGTEDGVIVNLPAQTSILATPYSGDNMWWSNNDKNWTDSGLTQTFSLSTCTPISFTIWADYVIETDWDYFFVEVFAPGTPITGWVQLPGYDANTGVTVTTSLDPNGRLRDYCEMRGGPTGCQLYNGLTGNSGGWANVRYDLTPWAGQTIQVRMTYATDAAYLDRGMFVDDISMDCPTGNLFFDDVEAGPDGWIKDDRTFDGSTPGAGWVIEDGTFIFPHYYLAEWRNLSGFDEGLAYAYNTKAFTVTATYSAWEVERTPYNVPGMLLWYRNYKYTANTPYPFLYDDPSEGAKGFLLVVDSHPEPYRWSPGSPPPNEPLPFSNLGGRTQTSNAAFTLQETTLFTLTNPFSPTAQQTFGPLPTVNQFHDSQGYAPGIAPYYWTGGAGWYLFWEDWDASVVVPATCYYWARYDTAAFGWEDLGNPGLCNYGVHIVVEDQATDGSWGKVHIWNDNDTFLGKKEVSDPNPSPGDTITYTITLKDSAGSDLASNFYTYTASLVDYIPVGSTYVDGSFSFSGHGSAGIVTATGQITWTGYLGGEELDVPDVVIEFAVVTNDGRACNMAEVTIGAAGALGYTPLYSSYELVTLGCGKFADVEGFKTVDLATANRGDTLLYTIVLTNSGEITATVTVNDHTPAWTTYVAGSATGGATFVRDNPHEGPNVGNILWNGEIGPGGVYVITFQVLIEDTAPDNTVITNQAEVTTPKTMFYLSASTLVEPFKIYLPIVLRNYP